MVSRVNIYIHVVFLYLQSDWFRVWIDLAKGLHVCEKSFEIYTCEQVLFVRFTILPPPPAVVSTLLTPLPVSYPVDDATPLQIWRCESRMSGATRDHSRLSDHGPDRSRQP